MAWVLVIIAGCFEVGFALLLKQSDGFSKLWPTIGFAEAQIALAVTCRVLFASAFCAKTFH